MDTLRDHLYTPSDVEAATGCDLKTQHNWVSASRGIFQTAIPEPRAGHPRQFPLTAVYEAGIYIAARDAEIPLSVIRLAFRMRCFKTQTAKTGRRAAYEGEGIDELPEFFGSGRRYWAIYAGAGVMLFDDDGDLAEVMHSDMADGTRPKAVFLINIGDIIDRVNGILRERLRAREKK